MALAANLLGTSGNDNLTGTPDRDVICGLEGNDIIHGGGGNDLLRGDSSRFQGGPYCDTSGQDGAADGDDTIYADTGSATGPDRLLGEGGNDLLVGGPDVDHADGGKGNDRILAGSGSRGPFRDYLIGKDGNDTMLGSPQGDVISGGKGNNVLRGGGGNDDLFAERGKSKYSAGRGDDFVLSKNGVRERVDCGAGRDKVNADKRDVLIRCEKRVSTGPMGPFKERPAFGKSPGGGGPR